MPDPEPTPLSQPETDALNRHGVFFKKQVLHLLQQIPNVKVVTEELGVTFGETRVVDILVKETTDAPIHFVIECKRTYADRKWIFFEDHNQSFRLLRSVTPVGRSSVFSGDSHGLSVCSEGYEIKNSDPKKPETRADQDPIFQAGSQIAAGYLGVIARRVKELVGRITDNPSESFVPVLVTTAELVVVNVGGSDISLETGNIPSPPIGSPVDFLLLKQPFPTPEGLSSDFRDAYNSTESWAQTHKESIFVVRSSALAAFISRSYRHYLARARG